jgi:hypothetical protein
MFAHKSGNRVLIIPQEDTSLANFSAAVPTDIMCLDERALTVALFGWDTAGSNKSESTDIGLTIKNTVSKNSTTTSFHNTPNNSPVVTCSLCFRKVGLWAYQSQVFDVLNEHKSFCPYLVDDGWKMVCTPLVGRDESDRLHSEKFQKIVDEVKAGKIDRVF